MEIVLCAVQPHLAAAWRERIGADLSNCVRVVEGDILSLDVLAVVSPANSYGFMDGGLDALYTRCFGPQLQQRLQRMIQEQANGELLVGQALLVSCALDAGLERVAIPGMGTGTGCRAPREAAAAMAWGIRDALYPPAFPAVLAEARTI